MLKVVRETSSYRKNRGEAMSYLMFGYCIRESLEKDNQRDTHRKTRKS